MKLLTNKKTCEEFATVEDAPLNIIRSQTRVSYVCPVASYMTDLNSEESRRVVTCRINQFVKVFGHVSYETVDWSKLDHHTITQYIKHMLKKQNGSTQSKSLNTIKATISAIKSVALHAVRNDILNHYAYTKINTVKGVKCSTVTKGRTVDVKDINLLTQWVLSRKRDSSARDIAILYLLYSCGLRRAELARLCMHDIYFDEQSFKVLGKGHQERLLYPPEFAWKALIEWVEGYRGWDDGFVFVRVRKGGEVCLNEGLTPHGIQYILNRAISESGSKPFKSHDLRSTFATTLLMKGEDIRTVSLLLGHGSVKTTEIYDLRGEAHKERANRLLKLSDD